MAKFGASSAGSGQIDDLVQYVTLHRPRPLILNGCLLPFIIVVGIWLYMWTFVYGFDDDAYYEAFIIILVVIACVQILVCLCCFWSVHIQTFLNCKKVPTFFNCNLPTTPTEKG